MKIAMLAHCHYPIAEPFGGGLEAHTWMVANELVRRGHAVTLFAKAGSRSRARVHPVVDADFVAGARDSSGHDPTHAIVDGGMTRAAEAVAAGSYDVILNNSLNPVPYTAYHDRPMLTLLHTPATLARVNAVIEHPDWTPGSRHAYAAVSKITRVDWQTVLTGVDIRWIPNGIDLDRWARPRAEPEDRLAVWAARITPEKGLPVAIAAARAAGFRLEISGPIADHVHYEQEVRPLLGDDVSYVGHLDHHRLPAFLQRGSVFVSSPAWPEPFGLSVVEAMAAGTPAAALPRGAAAEVVSPAGGVLARDCSAEALGEAIIAAAQLNRGKVRQSVRRFDRSRMVDAYERILAHLLSGHPHLTDPRGVRKDADDAMSTSRVA